MCRFKSGICLKDRVFVPDYNEHGPMLEELHITDDFSNASKVFVRFELIPRDRGSFSDVSQWKLHVDQDILPDWWDKEADLPRIRDAVKAWCDIHVLCEGVHEVHDGVRYAFGTAKVKAFGHAKVLAYDFACVEANGCASVTAYDRARVKARDSASVSVFAKASVEAYLSASVEACHGASVLAFDNTIVKAFDSTRVQAYGRATVILPECLSNPVVLHEEAICINHKNHTIQSPVHWVQKGMI